MRTCKGDIKHGKGAEWRRWGAFCRPIFFAPQQSLSYYAVLSQCPLESTEWFTLTSACDGCSWLLISVRKKQNVEPSKTQPLHPHPCRCSEGLWRQWEKDSEMYSQATLHIEIRQGLVFLKKTILGEKHSEVYFADLAY